MHFLPQSLRVRTVGGAVVLAAIGLIHAPSLQAAPQTEEALRIQKQEAMNAAHAQVDAMLRIKELSEQVDRLVVQQRELQAQLELLQTQKAQLEAECRAMSERTRGMVGFLEQSLRQADPGNRAAEVTTREVLEQAVARLHSQAFEPKVQAKLYESLAQAYRSLGDEAQGVDLLRRAAEIAPDSATVLQELGQNELRNGYLDAAKQYMERALALQPDSDRARKGLAEILANQGDLDRARALTEEAVRREGPDSDASLRLAELRMKQGEYQSAAETLEKYRDVLRLNSGEGSEEYRRALRSLARAYEHSGRSEQAEALLRRLVETEARLDDQGRVDSFKTLKDLSALLRDRGDLEASLALAAQATQRAREEVGAKHPETLELRLRLARTLVELGRKEEARAVVQSAVDTLVEQLGAADPRVKEARKMLENSAEEGKSTESLQALLHQLLRADPILENRSGQDSRPQREF